MKRIKLLSALLLTFVFINATSQQTPDRFDYQQAQGHQQTTVADSWEACPQTSIFSQPPHMPNDSWSAFTSDLFYPYLVYENYGGVSDPIGIVHFWGLNLIFNNGWSDCSTEDPMTFEIKFYQDNAGAPGTVVYTESLAISRDNTGLSYSGYPLYHYQANLSNPVNLAGGWISIQGTSLEEPNCVLLWMSSPVGDGFAWQLVPPNTNEIYYDLSLCFEGYTMVPVAPWALILGLILIASVMLLRYRRIV